MSMLSEEVERSLMVEGLMRFGNGRLGRHMNKIHLSTPNTATK